MKAVFTLLFAALALNVWAFDFKAAVEEAAKDEKMQAQAKELAKKGYEYFAGDKKEEKKEEKNVEKADSKVKKAQ